MLKLIFSLAVLQHGFGQADFGLPPPISEEDIPPPIEYDADVAPPMDDADVAPPMDDTHFPSIVEIPVAICNVCWLNVESYALVRLINGTEVVQGHDDCWEACVAPSMCLVSTTNPFVTDSYAHYVIYSCGDESEICNVNKDSTCARHIVEYVDMPITDPHTDPIPTGSTLAFESTPTPTDSVTTPNPPTTDSITTDAATSDVATTTPAPTSPNPTTEQDSATTAATSEADGTTLIPTSNTPTPKVSTSGMPTTSGVTTNEPTTAEPTTSDYIQSEEPTTSDYIQSEEPTTSDYIHSEEPTTSEYIQSEEPSGSGSIGSNTAEPTTSYRGRVRTDSLNPTPSEWNTIDERQVLIDYDLELNPLQIMTDSVVGSADQLKIYFYTDFGDSSGGIHIRFDRYPVYWIDSCSSNWVRFTMPEERVKTLTITETDTSLILTWNDVDIVSYLFSESSDCLSTWSQDTTKIMFVSNDYGADTASDEYRVKPTAPYECHHWTTEDESWRDARRATDRDMCEVHNPGNIYTVGDDNLAPGCGGCWCCRPTETEPIPTGPTSENYTEFTENTAEPTTTFNYVRPTEPEECRTFNCFLDPCSVASCSNYPDAECVANYCGGCNAEFYFAGTLLTDCEGNTTCTGDLEYQWCGAACSASCLHPEPVCTRECVSRCQCPASAPVLHEGACITQDMCPEIANCTVNGTVYAVGESWAQDPCTQCSCYEDEEINASVMCATILCDIPRCATELIYSPEECCPYCADACTFNGTVYEEGATWQPDPCEFCECVDEGAGKQQMCAVMACMEPGPDCVVVHFEGECCPSCLELDDCSVYDSATGAVIQYEADDSWAPDPCTTCSCYENEGGDLEQACATIYCDWPICDTMVIYPEGQCCPSCLELEACSVYDRETGNVTEYEGEESWSPDPCTTCTCFQDDSGTKQEMCAVVDCAWPVECEKAEIQLPEQCCSSCLAQCSTYDEGTGVITEYAAGDSWSPDPCTVCSCSEDELGGKQERCAVYDCAQMEEYCEPIYRDGECCPACKLRIETALAETEEQNEFLVEVSYADDTWGKVCDDFWDDTAAGLVCRKHGYSYGQAVSLYERSSSFLLTDVSCSGTRNISSWNLGDCAVTQYHNSQMWCENKESAGVRCYDDIFEYNAKIFARKSKSSKKSYVISVYVSAYKHGAAVTLRDDLFSLDAASFTVVSRTTELSVANKVKVKHGSDSSLYKVKATKPRGFEEGEGDCVYVVVEGFGSYSTRSDVVCFDD